jgi:hypothetical protein
MMNKRAFVFLFLITGLTVWSQSNVSTGFMPSIKISYILSERFRAIGGFETRNVILERWDDPEIIDYWRLIDLTSIASYRTSANTSLNLGYLARMTDGIVLSRFLQQFNVVQSLPSLRIGHRIATDQTFGQDFPLDFRIRYRITFEKPLSGDQVDPKEWYFKFGNEYLWSYQDNRSDIEIRLAPAFGYVINWRNRLEFGIDYRYNEFLLAPSDHDFWINLSWYGAFGSR